MSKYLFLSFFTLITILACQSDKEIYACKPCDLPCDKLEFSKAGICPHCKMQLVKKSKLVSEAALKVNEVKIDTGSGVFLIDGGPQKTRETINIYYHKPENYTEDSNILIVIPGAGRNADSYRDAWIAVAEEHSVLVIVPKYIEEAYPFEAYHLCGLIKNTNLRTTVEYVQNTNIAKLDETAFTFEVNTNSTEWIFNDFDRIFDVVKKETASTQSTYDLFGHSAGGQILHRLAIFQPESKVNRIIAANSGFYTLPSFEKSLPFGIKDTPIKQTDLKKAFEKKLVLLLGELDNEQETGGTLLHSISANEQGGHRLERGKYFYNFSKDKAKNLGAKYNWKVKIVPNIGHNHRGMGKVAAEILYQ